VSSFVYLSKSEVHAIHIVMMETYGQPPQPLVHEDLLDSAINRVRWAESFEDMALPQLAARLATAVALAHAFTDGNKRTAWQASLVFLDRNGYGLQTEAEGLELAQRIEAVVAAIGPDRQAEEEGLASWFAEHLVPVDQIAPLS
jgi:death-on-curing protein